MAPNPEARSRGHGRVAKAEQRHAHEEPQWDHQSVLPVGADAPFTLRDIKESIPKHCWERSTLRSFRYLAVDLAVSAALYYCALQIEALGSSSPLVSYLWPVYWVLQGCVQTGIWVIAHECGHQAFSESQWVNDSVGFVLHSFLLVPYFSWKYTHAKHHKNTGSMDGDEVFVPAVKRETSDNPIMFSPLVRAFWIVVTLTIGWPLHLFMHFTGQKYPTYTSHFTTFSDLFSQKQKPWVLASDVGIILMVSLITYVSNTMGFWWMARVYGVPYLIVNFWLVFITLLQHTDRKLPHYRGKEWNWLRGALATVDRNYGVLNHVFHHIGDTHVAHHLFSYMPHYHAQEASEAIKKVIGKYYMYDPTNIFVAMWKAFEQCHYVDDEPEDAVLWYKQHGKKF